jgi:hypothetical protein
MPLAFFKSAKVGRYMGNFLPKQEGTRGVSHPSGKYMGSFHPKWEGMGSFLSKLYRIEPNGKNTSVFVGCPILWFNRVSMSICIFIHTYSISLKHSLGILNNLFTPWNITRP